MEHVSSSTSRPPETDLVELHRELAKAWGLDFHRVRALVCQLKSSHWCSVSELIAQTLLSHWNVTHLLQRLDPWLEHEQDRVRIRVAFQDLFRAVFDCSRLSSECFLTPYEIAAQAGEEALQAEAVLASMEHVMKDLPMRPVRHLDHVSATPLTCLKRALFLAKNYELRGATILLLGDHDLTSLALAQVAPGVAITVVDSDERILDYINAVAGQRGWMIRTLFADLRIALPRSVEASCDLVLTKDRSESPGHSCKGLMASLFSPCSWGKITRFRSQADELFEMLFEPPLTSPNSQEQDLYHDKQRDCSFQD